MSRCMKETRKQQRCTRKRLYRDKQGLMNISTINAMLITHDFPKIELEQIRAEATVKTCQVLHAVGIEKVHGDVEAAESEERSRQGRRLLWSVCSVCTCDTAGPKGLITFELAVGHCCTPAIHSCTIMFSSQLGRAARVGSQSASISTSSCAVANRVSSATCPTLLSRQRRLSSSKASCPPNGDSNRSRQPVAKPDLPSSRPAKSRSSNANKSNSSSRNVKAAKDETFANLPSVPSTEHILPQGAH